MLRAAASETLGVFGKCAAHTNDLRKAGVVRLLWSSDRRRTGPLFRSHRSEREGSEDGTAAGVSQSATAFMVICRLGWSTAGTATS